MQSKNDHTIIVKALKSGDATAFEHVYDLYKHPLFATALRYLKDQKLAEDALQEIFVKLWQNREAIDELQSLRSFLFVCLKNHVLNIVRTEQTRIKAALLANQNKERISHQTESDIALNDLRTYLDTSLSALPARKKRIVQLSLIEGYSNQEIAATLQISENTVRSQLSQAKKVIRRFLEQTLVLLILLSI
ncbi:MAG: RNA polymerase sigma-70 factor [Bacteroidota bacterium]